MSVLNNKKIILGVCAGIAAYKSAELLRLLIKQGADVQVVMTQLAEEFIGPITFAALSGKEVRSRLFDLSAEAGMSHIELAQWADLVIIAPATANTMAKIAHGMADDLLNCLCLATKAPIIIAPAMNQQMWFNEATKENIKCLSGRMNIHLCGPAEGEQACGDTGPGRMEEPEVLLSACLASLAQKKEVNKDKKEEPAKPLLNKRIVITAGPTIEDIDPVRYISNRSSGKMGYAIAQAAQAQGADVFLISGPVALNKPDNVHVISVRSAQQMYDAVFEEVATADVFIATAAVVDYRPVEKITKKIKKNSHHLTIELVQNPDILMAVSELKNRPVCIGFAAETNDVKDYAIKKLKKKKLDMVAANKVGEAEGFDVDDNELHLFWPENNSDYGYKKLPYASKQQLSKQLISEIILRFI